MRAGGQWLGSRDRPAARSRSLRFVGTCLEGFRRGGLHSHRIEKGARGRYCAHFKGLDVMHGCSAAGLRGDNGEAVRPCGP